MHQFHRKNILASLLWFGTAAAVLFDFLRGAAAIEALRVETDAFCIYWVPAINPFIVVPLTVTGGLMLYGHKIAGLVFGVPSIAYVAYAIGVQISN